MPQVKKAEVQESIRDAAFMLFSENGYRDTSISQIAKESGVTVGNIYRYYSSKFELFYQVLAPWLDEQFGAMERRLEKKGDPRAKLAQLLTFLWVDLPAMDNNFQMNLITALANKKPEDVYSRALLEACEARVLEQLSKILPESSTTSFDLNHLARLLFMAHDGFILSASLVDERQQTLSLIDQFSDLLLIQSGA